MLKTMFSLISKHEKGLQLESARFPQEMKYGGFLCPLITSLPPQPQNSNSAISSPAAGFTQASLSIPHFPLVSFPPSSLLTPPDGFTDPPPASLIFQNISPLWPSSLHDSSVLNSITSVTHCFEVTPSSFRSAFVQLVMAGGVI